MIFPIILLIHFVLYLNRKDAGAPARNSVMVEICLSAWQQLFEHKMIHLNLERYLKDDWDYVGQLIPISDDFFFNKSMEKISYMILRNIPWSFNSATKANKNKNKNKKKTNACLVDYLLFATQYRAQYDCICEYGMIKEKILKYYACLPCTRGKGHYTSPWDYWANARASRLVTTAYSSCTLGSIVQEYQKVVEKEAPNNQMMKNIMCHFYCNSFAIMERINEIEDDEQQKKDIITAIQKRGGYELPDILKDFFNLKTTKIASPLPQFYDHYTMNVSHDLLTRQQKQIKKIENRESFLLLTTNVSMPRAEPGIESSFFCPIDAAQIRRSAYAVDPYYHDKDYDKPGWRLQKVNLIFVFIFVYIKFDFFYINHLFIFVYIKYDFYIY